MKTPLLMFAAAMLATGSAQAQYWRDFRKHHVWGGLGVAQPGQDLKPYYKNAFAWSAGYGFRPLKFVQFDAGYEGSYNSADVNDYLNSPYGYLRIRDFQVFVPIGGRLVLPVARGRVEFYGGGGGAYTRYLESLRQPNEWTRIGCPYCQARDGWGYYAMAGASVALDRAQNLRLGMITRVYRVQTTGPQIGALPLYKSNDRWVNSFLTLTFSF